MCEAYAMPGLAAAAGLFAARTSCWKVEEPRLDELMRDPMIVALMTADRVDRHSLDAMLTRMQGNLR